MWRQPWHALLAARSHSTACCLSTGCWRRCPRSRRPRFSSRPPRCMRPWCSWQVRSRRCGRPAVQQWGAFGRVSDQAASASARMPHPPWNSPTHPALPRPPLSLSVCSLAQQLSGAGGRAPGGRGLFGAPAQPAQAAHAVAAQGAGRRSRHGVWRQTCAALAPPWACARCTSLHPDVFD